MASAGKSVTISQILAFDCMSQDTIKCWSVCKEKRVVPKRSQASATSLEIGMVMDFKLHDAGPAKDQKMMDPSSPDAMCMELVWLPDVTGLMDWYLKLTARFLWT
jgi:hypothetical protein